ncbi:hypothetical protein ACHAW5_002789 [Stephanodiscus triporus]|uniref:PDZ domain-containing protein n=1 Tax=Stephanodiscus triporus TaxID=2934178 RepID=A0ABD3NJK6_9STRA
MIRVRGGVTKRGEKIPGVEAGVLGEGEGDAVVKCDHHAAVRSVLLNRSHSISRGRNRDNISCDGGGDGEHNEKNIKANRRNRSESLPRSLIDRSGRGRSQEPRRRSSSVFGSIINGRRDRSKEKWMHSPLPLVSVPAENSVSDEVELSYVTIEKHFSFHDDDDDQASGDREQNPINGPVEGGEDGSVVGPLFRRNSSSCGTTLSSSSCLHSLGDYAATDVAAVETGEDLLLGSGEYSGSGKKKSRWNRYFTKKHWKKRHNNDNNQDNRTGGNRSVGNSTVESGISPRSSARNRRTTAAVSGSSISADESLRSINDCDHYDCDAPWTPTESLLHQIGQLDRIDDDGQDEVDVDDFEKSINNDDHKKDVIDSFIDGVVNDDTDNHHKNNSYARGDDDDVGGERNNEVARGGGRIDGDKSDTHSSGGERRYQRDDEYYLSDSLNDLCDRVASRRALSKDVSLPLRESKNKQRGSSNSSTTKKGFSLSKSIVRIGRGRSRGRKEEQTNANHHMTMEKMESIDTNNYSDSLVASPSKKKKKNRTASSTTGRDKSPSLFGGGRGRSFSLNPLRRSTTTSSTETALHEGETFIQQQLFGRSDTKSLPPPPTRTRISKFTTARDDDDDDNASSSNSSSCRHFHRNSRSLSSSLSRDVSNLSSNQKEKKNKSRKKKSRKCLVCRQKISLRQRGEDGCCGYVRYMDFFFCSDNGESTCFQCGTCRRPLSSKEGCGDDVDIQIISNARGSIVQCGQCAELLMGGGLVSSSSSLPPAGAGAGKRAAVLVSASASTSTSSAPAVIAAVESGLNSRGADSTARGGGADDYSKALKKAAKRLAEKALVKISLLGSCMSDGGNDDDIDGFKSLSTLFFMQNEDEKNQSKRIPKQSLYVNQTPDERDNLTTTCVAYELDSDVFGNPNYDGYNCSFSKFDDINNYNRDLATTFTVMPPPVSPRVTTVSLPKLESDEINGAITPKLNVEMSWVDDDGSSYDDESSAKDDGTRSYIHPKRRGPAVLSIESFQSETITKDTVRKVLRQIWEYEDEEENVVYDFAFAVPFKKEFISWEIDEGDELDLPLCSFEVNSKRPLDPDRDDNDNFSELLSAASCNKSVILLPSIIYIKVEKKDFDEEIGLSLIEKNGATVVAEVSKSGVFASSEIKEGCELLAINGQCVRGPRSVIRIMKELVGIVVITISDSPSPPGSRFVVTKNKLREFGEEMGDIKFNMSNGLVRVQEVTENGIFAGCLIKKGDICLSIDGLPAISNDVAARALARSQSIVSILIFSLPEFWTSIVEFLVDRKFVRWWHSESECRLLQGNNNFAPIMLSFDAQTGLCTGGNNEEDNVDLDCMNTIIHRVMNLLIKSINAYRVRPKGRERSRSRSLSVSASGKIVNRSDVYRRALIKLDEMRENGKLSAEDYEAGKKALMQVAIQI